jgi:hypothetical protein
MSTGCLLTIFNLVRYQEYCPLLAGDKIGLVLVSGCDIAFLQLGEPIHCGANGDGAENEV